MPHALGQVASRPKDVCSLGPIAKESRASERWPHICDE